MAPTTPPPLLDGVGQGVPLPKTPPLPWLIDCDGCDKTISAPSEALLLKQLDFHVKVTCPVLKSVLKTDDEDKFMFTKLVNENELNKMEVKDKCGEMSPVDWRRFFERWAVWKKLQPPGRDLGTSLLGLVLLARNEITNEINGDYSEDIIMMAMEKLIKNGSTREMRGWTFTVCVRSRMRGQSPMSQSLETQPFHPS